MYTFKKYNITDHKQNKNQRQRMFLKALKSNTKHLFMRPQDKYLLSYVFINARFNGIVFCILEVYKIKDKIILMRQYYKIQFYRLCLPL